MDDDDEYGLYDDDAALDSLDYEELQAIEEGAVKHSQVQSNPRVSPATGHGGTLRVGSQAAAWQQHQGARSSTSSYRQHQQYEVYKGHRQHVSYTEKQRQQREKEVAQFHKAQTYPARRGGGDGASMNASGRLAVDQRLATYERMTIDTATYREEPTLPDKTLPHSRQDYAGVAGGGGEMVPDKPSSDYGDFVDEAAELWDVAGSVMSVDQNVQAVAASGAQRDPNATVTERREAAIDFGGDALQRPSPLQEPSKADQESMAELLRLKGLIEQLGIEKNQLETELERAKSAEQAKIGEVSIVRSNLERAKEENKRVIASLQNTHAEERNKLQLETELLKEDKKRIETELQFLKNDLEESTRVNRSLSKRQKMSFSNQPDASNTNANDFTNAILDTSNRVTKVATPKRGGLGFAYRDGFEDADIIMRSPSKRAKNKTPKGGSKRKRPTHEHSPIFQLPLSQSRATPAVLQDNPIIDDRALSLLWAHGLDDRIELCEAIIMHHSPRAQQRTLDVLAGISFPSSPNISLSESFFDKLTNLKAQAPQSRFSIGICQILLNMWEQCLDEKFFKGLASIIDLVRFCISWTHGSFCHDMMDQAIHLVQNTIDVNGRIYLRIGKDVGPPRDDIDVITCLALLEDIALAVSGVNRHIKRFWKVIRVDLPIILLNPRQLPTHIQKTVSILCTSALEDTFGPITSNDEKQRANEVHLLEAASRLLENFPKPHPGERKASQEEILQLQLEVIQFLGCVARFNVGALAFVKHETLLSRLCSRISEEIDELYEWRSGNHLRAPFINHAVKVLSSILSKDYVGCSQKLKTPGIGYKHIVAMARLAFSDMAAQEAGIEDDTSYQAHTLLDDLLTAEEADALYSMFEAS